MRRSQKRLIVIAAAGVLLSTGVAAALLGARDSVSYYYRPGELAQKARTGDRVRIGGMVTTGSLREDPTRGLVHFTVADGDGGTIDVKYEGIPPDLFGEGQGVVAEGVWRGAGPLVADRILAKHDETYLPREVADALKSKGEWRGEGDPPAGVAAP